MTEAFTDEDLKAFADEIVDKLPDGRCFISCDKADALLNRLKAAERVINPDCGSIGCMDEAYKAWRRVLREGVMAMDHNCVLEIGPYEISKSTGLNGDYWIQHESGEGMQVADKLVIAMIDEFYKKNF